MKILLISGHGAGDPGATATIAGKTYKEAEETIVMVKKIKEQLAPYDVTVDLYPTERNAFEDAKSNKLAVDFGKYDYVLEIHFNACVNDLKGNEKVTGTEAFITTTDKNSAAESEMLSCLKAIGLTNRGVKRNNYTVIYRANAKGADSCLLEVCFIDDADDMKIYLSNKDTVAKSIAIGVVKGFNLKKKTKEEPKKEPKVETKTEKVVAAAKSYDKNMKGTYTVTAKNGLNLRYVPGNTSDDNLIKTMAKGTKVQSYGYYTTVDGTKWLLVVCNGNVGYCSKEYLK